MRDPIVSVVIPTRDRWVLLQRALASVFLQTTQAHEVVVVDDGSTDGTVGRLAELDDPRINVIALGQSGGAPHARNVGMDASGGRYIAFLDSDDEWLPNYLETTLLAFATQPPPVAVCSAMIRRAPGSDVVVRPTWSEDCFERLVSHRSPVCPAIVIDHETTAGARWDETLPAMQERDFLISLSRNGTVACSPDPLYVQREDGSDRISVPRNQVLAREMLIHKYGSELANRPAALANNYFRLARTQHTLGDRDGVRESLKRASAADPSDRRYRALAGVSAMGSGAASLGLSAYYRLARVRDRAAGRSHARPAR